MVVSHRKVIALLLLRRRMLRRRRFGIHPINRKRWVHGEFHKLVPQLRDDPARFKEHFRLKPEQFDLLLELLHNSLLKRSQRAPLSPEERLAVTLRYLATGNSFRSLAFNFRVGVSTLHNVVADATKAICTVLRPEYLRTPRTSTCCLHNFLIDTSPESALILVDKGDDDNGRWRQEGPAFPQAQVQANRANWASDAAMQMRETLANCFSGDGALGWQVDRIAREDGVLPETDDEDDVQDDATVAGDA
ncbi:nuclease HARBI1-like protein [Aphelenchoides avenae]|nr:nuclease HARBI1-like protein [Aphelenchus avenae]